MSREGVVIVLGVLIAVSPFIGLPYYLLAWVLPVLGLACAGIALSLRVKRGRTRAPQPSPASSTVAYDPASPSQ